MDESLQIAFGCLGAIALAAGLVIAERILPRPAGEAPDLLREALRFGGWTVAATALAIAAYLLVGGLVVFLALLVAAAAAIRDRRSGWSAVFGTLAVAAERNLPWIDLLDALAAEQGGILGGRTRRLAALLRSGWPLAEALPQAGAPLRHEDLAAIALGQEADAVAAALRQTLDRYETRSRFRSDAGDKLLYATLLTYTAFFSIFYIAHSVAPSMSRVFADFGVSPPPATQVFFDLSDRLEGQPLWILPLGALAGFSALWALRYRGWIAWDPPGLGWLTRRLYAADLLETLALAVQRRQPLPRTLMTLGGPGARRWARRRMVRALFDLERGVEWPVALGRQGLLRPAERAVLEAASRVGNLPWALREMAETIRRRLGYRLRLVLHFAFPMVILSFAALIAAFVVAYFYPLVLIIAKLA